MAGIYIHIPFCKQACHYCDFHFSTSFKKSDQMIAAIQSELQLRKDELGKEATIETIYFGGGTPSVLSTTAINAIIETVCTNYTVAKYPEITLEANPDDLTEDKIKELATSPINRLSIGIQSFFESDLKLMNRAHNAEEAKACISNAKKYFDNISIDLIYGIPNMSKEQWKTNIDLTLQFDIPHISCYALTVEPNTALPKLIEKGVIDPVQDELAQTHFEILIDTLLDNGYEHYELSNFGKPDFYSKNNTAYWQGKPYLGIGPSAHSYHHNTRSWNINNNSKYIQAISEGELPQEIETLSKVDQYNEYVMIGLRTQWGVSLKRIQTEFGKSYYQYMMQQAEKHIAAHLLYIDEDRLLVSKKGKFLSDGLASDLFLLNLDPDHKAL